MCGVLICVEMQERKAKHESVKAGTCIQRLVHAHPWQSPYWSKTPDKKKHDHTTTET